MVKKLSVAHPKTSISRGIVSGVIIGGFIGILIGLILRTNNLMIPTLLGIVIGGIIGGILVSYSTKSINNAEYVPEANTPKQNSSKNVTLQIKEEQLDLAKEWMQTGEVKIYKESFIQEKSFTVPIKYEELVIEKKDLALSTPEHKDGSAEVIRILLSEEQVEFTKQKVAIEDVSIYKQQIEDIKHIEETVKREEPKVRISGSSKVRDKSNLKNS